MNQFYKRILPAILFPMVVMAVLAGIYAINKSQGPYPFERKLKNLVKGVKVINISYNSFYIAGFTDDHLYLGNKTAVKYLLKVNTAMTDTQSIRIQVNKAYLKNGVYKLTVDSANFYLMDGSTRTMVKGRTGEWIGKADTIDLPYFSENIPLNDNSMVCRFVDFKTRTNSLKKVSRTRPSITNGNLLEKQVDGLFCTDGLLQYHQQLQLLSYMYFYRNRVLLMDTNLNLLKKMKTIDPIDTAKFKIAKIESSKSLTFSSPALMVNANSCSSGRLVFIESKIQAMNDLETIFKDAMVIDVYDLIGQQYLYSFYLRSHNQQKTTQFKVIGNYIFVVSGQYLIRYTIELPEN